MEITVAEFVGLLPLSIASAQNPNQEWRYRPGTGPLLTCPVD